MKISMAEHERASKLQKNGAADTRSFLTDCWYLAAWSHELTNQTGLARTILEVPVALFRDGDGLPHALLDRCPHRFAPLSRGAVAGGFIRCGYHGLAFGPSGACVDNPHGPIVRALCVRRYPVVERHRMIWIWMGDSDAADPARIPDLGFLSEAPDTAFNSGYLHGRGHYQLFVDNILDLTHADYLHPATLGSGAISRTRATVIETSHSISIEWHCIDEPLPPFLASLMPANEVRVNSWTKVDWMPPATLVLRTGAVEKDTGKEVAGRVENVHIFTPESPRTTHYFFASTRDFAVDDAELNARIADTRLAIFSTEDEPMIQAQQERIGSVSFWDFAPVMLRTDEAAVRVRRRMDQLIAVQSGR